MSGESICGVTTTKGTPCQNNAGSCPWHNTDEPPDTGRPSKLSYDRQERIATAIESGVPVVAACRLNEISYDTYKRWKDIGKDEEEGPHAEFYERVARALGHDQSEKTQKLWEIAEKSNDTATMLTILKQRYPETWQDQDIGEARSLNVMLPENAQKPE